MKVLHVISNIDLRAGGPASALAGLTLAQSQAHLDVRLVAAFAENDKTDLADQLARQGVKTCLVGPVSGLFGSHPEMISTLYDAISEVDIVHIHAIWEEIQHQAACAARHLKTPYIFRPCGMLDPWSLAQSKWKKKIYMALRLRKDLNGAAAVHFTTQTEADLVKPLHLTSPQIVEPNGVNLEEFETLPRPGTFRSRYPQIGEAPLIIFLSRIHYKKGLDLLVPAFAKLASKNVFLIIAGPDPDGYGEKIRRLAADSGVADRVIFTGMLYNADRVAALADADLFCLPSYQENFGIAVAEALAAGTPVVISDQVNLCSDVLAGHVGGVVPCDVDALAKELDRWLSDASLRGQAADATRPFVWERYDWRQIAKRWAAHYQQIQSQSAKR
ncbi:MAG TPA: glycosyltransferase [Tepidisphaeraceae bacterium]|nr:glycosyltransferase [Tepidisphaeraceae bacterium]